MSYNSFNSDSINNPTKDTFRSGTHKYRMIFSGLRPNTKHKMYLDNVDYSWACIPYGGMLGDDLVTNENGILHVFVLYEIPFSQPAEYEMPKPSGSSSQFNSPNSRMEDVVKVVWKTFEVRSLDNMSHAAVSMHFHILLQNNDVNRIEQHD